MPDELLAMTFELIHNVPTLKSVVRTCRRFYNHCVKHLYIEGSEPSRSGRHPMHWASTNDRTSLAERTVELTHESCSYSDLDLAISHGRATIAKILVAVAGVQGEMQRNNDGVDLVWSAALRGMADVMKTLLAAGAHPGREWNLYQGDGTTLAGQVPRLRMMMREPLAMAAHWGHVEVCRVLLANGAKPDPVLKDILPPLDPVSAEERLGHNRLGIINVLVSHDADPNLAL